MKVPARYNLTQLIAFFYNQNMPATGLHYEGLRNDPVTEDGWIDKAFVRNKAILTESDWRKLESCVTTAILIEGLA